MDGLSFDVTPGKITGFLGPDGTGKSISGGRDDTVMHNTEGEAFKQRAMAEANRDTTLLNTEAEAANTRAIEMFEGLVAQYPRDTRRQSVWGKDRASAPGRGLG